MANNLSMSLAIALGLVDVEKFFGVNKKALFVESRSSKAERGENEDKKLNKQQAEKMRRSILENKYSGRNIRDVIIELYKAGMNFEEIASELYTCKYNVSYHLERAGKYKRSNYHGGIRNSVSQYSIDGEHIADYVSVTEAGRQTGIPRTSIANCCIGTVKSARGFIFAYKD